MNILYYNENNFLSLEKTDLSEFSNTVETPFYIYSSEEIRRNCETVLERSGPFDLFPCYAVKANYNPAILKIVLEKGFGADVVSSGELYFALKAGFSPEKIMFAGVGKTEAEMRYAIEQGIHSLNIESESELKLLVKIAGEMKLTDPVRAALRVNPDVDPQTHPYISTGLKSNKFGIAGDKAFDLFLNYRRNQNLSLSGIHVHIGSQISSPEPYLETAAYLHKFVMDLRKKNVEIEFLDLGGGIGINYEQQIDGSGTDKTYLNNILNPFLEKLKELQIPLFIELGRSLVGSAGLLVTKILYIKKTPHKTFYIVDAGMNNLIRPSLYDAHHQIIPLHKTDSREIKVDVVGPVCESSDFLAKDRLLPELKEGDYLAVTGAGAYGQVQSSNYNLRPIIAEYLIEKEEIKTIHRRQRIEDIAAQYTW